KLRRLDCGNRVLRIELAEDAHRRPRLPFRRLEALHAPAFLVDENRKLRAAAQSPQLVRQLTDLGARCAIALEEDEAPRARVLKERALVRREGEAGEAVDRGGRTHDRSPSLRRRGWCLSALDHEALLLPRFQSTAERIGVVLGFERANAQAVIGALPGNVR